ncbi:hypothetical protein SAMN05443247_04956 [Bradyrhizobium erythrophlei]|jgi:hypothetical protein|nr:hypothetical protein SAMN05443247_04956 [Bradyrhizobium erythrophlei]
MPNRQERRRAVATRVEMIEANRIVGNICCWNGCDKTYNSKDGMPKGWQCILMFRVKPSSDLGTIKPGDWSRDGVLCPEHVEHVQSLLVPLALEVATRPSEGQA